MLPLLRDHLIPYAQLTVGPAVAFTKWTDAAGTSRESFFGYHAGALAGAAVMPRPSLGLFIQTAYYYAPDHRQPLRPDARQRRLGLPAGGSLCILKGPP